MSLTPQVEHYQCPVCLGPTDVVTGECVVCGTPKSVPTVTTDATPPLPEVEVMPESIYDYLAAAYFAANPEATKGKALIHDGVRAVLAEYRRLLEAEGWVIVPRDRPLDMREASDGPVWDYDWFSQLKARPDLPNHLK